MGLLDRADLRPDRLPGRRVRQDSPAVGQCVHDDQPAPSLIGNPGNGRKAIAARIRDLDPQPGALKEDQTQPEAPAWQTSMPDGVRGQLGDDYRGGFRALTVGRPSPLRDLLDGKQSREPRAAPRGAEQLGELRCRCGRLGRHVSLYGFALHIIQRGGAPTR